MAKSDYKEWRGEIEFPFLFTCGTSAALANHYWRMSGPKKQSCLTIYIKYPCGGWVTFYPKQVGISDEEAMKMACTRDLSEWLGKIAAVVGKLTFEEFKAAREVHKEAISL